MAVPEPEPSAVKRYVIKRGVVHEGPEIAIPDLAIRGVAEYQEIGPPAGRIALLEPVVRAVGGLPLTHFREVLHHTIVGNEHFIAAEEEGTKAEVEGVIGDWAGGLHDRIERRVKDHKAEIEELKDELQSEGARDKPKLRTLIRALNERMASLRTLQSHMADHYHSAVSYGTAGPLRQTLQTDTALHATSWAEHLNRVRVPDDEK